MRTTTKSKVTIFLENVIFTYRKIEDFRHIGFLYIAIAIVPIAAFLLAALLNFANHRYEVDITALPVEKQERFNYLSKTELKMRANESYLKNEFRFEEAKVAYEKRWIVKKELLAILSEAPYCSWGYKFFDTFGLVNNKNIKIAAMQKG